MEGETSYSLVGGTIEKKCTMFFLIENSHAKLNKNHIEVWGFLERYVVRSVSNNNSATEPFGPFLFSKKHQQFQNKMVPSRGLTYPPDRAYLKMIFVFPRWDMLISWRVILSGMSGKS